MPPSTVIECPKCLRWYLAFFGGTFLWFRGYYVGMRDMRQSATKRGYGHWVIVDDQGATYWQWKENEPKEEGEVK